MGLAKSWGTVLGEGKDDAVEGEGNPKLELDVAGDVSMCACGCTCACVCE